MRTQYVYKRVLTKWPDWCSEYGWDNEYTDTPDWNGHDPYDEDPRPTVPSALREMLSNNEGLAELLEAERAENSDSLWSRVKMPSPRRVQWLSREPAKKWVTAALALGAEAHIERGWVVWEDELNQMLAKFTGVL